MGRSLEVSSHVFPPALFLPKTILCDDLAAPGLKNELKRIVPPLLFLCETGRRNCALRCLAGQTTGCIIACLANDAAAVSFSLLIVSPRCRPARTPQL